MSLQNILDTDSEDEIPPGWEERVNIDGKVYYANHESKQTQWTHPVTGKKKTVKGDLPFGWERCFTEDGTVFYVESNEQNQLGTIFLLINFSHTKVLLLSHINQKTTYTDPRLAFAEEVKDSLLDIRQKFDGSSTALQILHGRDLTGHYVVITGSNTGIGFETARSLALHGATVIMACRDIQAAHVRKTEIMKEQPNAKVEVMYLDLSILHSVKKFAEEYERKKWPLQVLILNAGVFGIPWQLTEDGLEYTFQVNHLAHFYLVYCLHKVLVSSAPSRVVVVSSESHRFSDLTVNTLDELSPPAGKYSDLKAYNNSKLCNILFANMLNSKMYSLNVTALSLHPGNMMSTSIARYWWGYRLLFAIVRPFTKSMQQGAATTVYCAVAEALDGVGGLYFNNCFPCEPSSRAADSELGMKLWHFSLKLLQERVGEITW